MKVLLFMAITPNGYISKEDDNTSWVSKDDWKRFEKILRKTKNVVIGRRTFDVMKEEGTFPMPCTNIVMTHEPVENKWGNKVIFTDKKPKEVLEMLKARGFKTAVVAGGGHLNASFMKEGLVDEIFVDIMPHLLGKGIKLFEEQNFEFKLKLLEARNVSKNEVQLHYKILK